MSDTFKLPDNDETTTTLPQYIQYNGKNYPNHPLFVYSISHDKLETITWSKTAQAMENAARMVYPHIKSKFRSGSPPPVVGILANLDFITYNTLALGIVRAGGSAFLISTRNSGSAVVELLKQTDTQTLYVSVDEPIQKLASATLATPELRDVSVHIAPIFEDLFFEQRDTKYTCSVPDYPGGAMDSPAIILHSSGTTSFPKPVYGSHRMILQWSMNIRVQCDDVTKQRLAVHGLPAFHGMGIAAFLAARMGMSLAVFPPKNPPIVPSPQNVLDGAIACQSTILLSVPLLIEHWSSSAENVEHLKQLDLVCFGGGPLNKAIGDELSRAGVSLAGLYGTHACYYLYAANHWYAIPGEPTDEWDWLEISPRTTAVFLPQKDEPSIFELIYIDCPTHWSTTTNYQMEGRRAFATNDLVRRHPTDPTKFKILGRKDDQIMLSTGEKTNPAPIEEIIAMNPLVQFAVMFGRGRDQNGILLQPAKGHEIDPRNEITLAKFRSDVWSSVEAANAFAPSHSRLFKEMVLVTHPSRPMELTAKLAPRKSVVIEAYKDEIEAAYSAASTSIQRGITPPSDWTLAEVLKFVRAIVHTIMGTELMVDDNDDIFQRGSNSLQATYIRNSLIQAVSGKNKESARRISQSFVYSNPTVSALAHQLVSIVRPGLVTEGDEDALKIERMRDLISEFSADFPTHRVSTHQSAFEGEVVLLTGSTGGFGCQLLAHLVSLPNVRHVYALNRGGDNSLRERQAEALTQRGLDAGVVELPKVSLVECDTAADHLGIELSLHNEILDNITLIIHNAWRVNFNMALDTFKPVIRSVRNLIDFALQSPKAVPPRFIFIGSIGVYKNWNSLSRPLEASIIDPRIVLGSGYAESKWVGERILEEAANNTPLQPVIVRIGQMTSNSSGAWNAGDWLPAIVRSGQVVGALPSRDDSIAWISLESAAQAIFDFRLSRSQYLHLTHPHPVPWATVFSVFASMLHVPLVPWEEWVIMLETDTTGPESNPAVHLLDFFRSASSKPMQGREALGSPLLDLTEALKASPTLVNPSLPHISEIDAENWIKYWKHSRYLTGSEMM
ncbi:acetyl-CoA synthetase-like protein [Ramaria rubella]|nr:acetyl-CoA synthetase-like protein [Ramaria rubella]